MFPPHVMTTEAHVGLKKGRVSWFLLSGERSHQSLMAVLNKLLQVTHKGIKVSRLLWTLHIWFFLSTEKTKQKWSRVTINKGENVQLVLESLEPGSPSEFTVDFLLKKNKTEGTVVFYILAICEESCTTDINCKKLYN